MFGTSSWEQVSIPAGDGAAMLLPPPGLDPIAQAQVQILTQQLYWFWDVTQTKYMTSDPRCPHL